METARIRDKGKAGGPPRVAAFDLGKVLLDFDYEVAAANLSRHTRANVKELAEFFLAGNLLERLERGRIGAQEFFNAFQKACGFEGSLEQFRDLLGSMLEEIPQMTAFLPRLKQAGAQLYVFSNTNELAIEHIRRRFPFYQLFDGYALSYERGLMKPEPAFYEVVERLTGRSGPEIFFVDDRPENVRAALDRGWRAIVHRSPEASRKAMEDAGLLSRLIQPAEEESRRP